MLSSSEKLSTPHQEISWLGKTIKEQQNTEYFPSTERVGKKVLEEYAKREASNFLRETHILPAHDLERLALKLKPEEHDKKIEELFAIALEKGIKNALDLAEKLADPHVQDDFHRFL